MFVIRVVKEKCGWGASSGDSDMHLVGPRCMCLCVCVEATGWCEEMDVELLAVEHWDCESSIGMQ